MSRWAGLQGCLAGARGCPKPDPWSRRRSAPPEASGRGCNADRPLSVSRGVEVVDSAPGSYADLVAAHGPALLLLAVMLTGDPHEAEDLLQSTLLRTVRHGERVAAMSAPVAYLRRVMLNEHLSNGRRLQRMVPVARPSRGAPEPSVPPATATIDHRDEAWRWLATLKPLQRAVLVLRFYEDLPDAEIAQLLGCAEATVRSHALRGLAALRRHLSNPGTGVEDR